MSQKREYVRNHEYAQKERKTWEGYFTKVRESDKAVLLWEGTGKVETDAKWVPKSQIIHMNKTEVEGDYNVEMTEWIAGEKGFL